jgi:hypothetical protein
VDGKKNVDIITLLFFNVFVTMPYNSLVAPCFGLHYNVTKSHKYSAPVAKLWNNGSSELTVLSNTVFLLVYLCKDLKLRMLECKN